MPVHLPLIARRAGGYDGKGGLDAAGSRGVFGLRRDGDGLCLVGFAYVADVVGGTVFGILFTGAFLGGDLVFLRRGLGRDGQFRHGQRMPSVQAHALVGVELGFERQRFVRRERRYAL